MGRGIGISDLVIMMIHFNFSVSAVRGHWKCGEVTESALIFKKIPLGTLSRMDSGVQVWALNLVVRLLQNLGSGLWQPGLILLIFSSSSSEPHGTVVGERIWAPKPNGLGQPYRPLSMGCWPRFLTTPGHN